MYFLIMEDGSIKKSLTVSDEDKQCADDGILDIIDLHIEKPMRWIDGAWVDIDSVSIG